jgi:MarR family transcriptional regulator, negative regulator of the multidrug operon emrRAB
MSNVIPLMSGRRAIVSTLLGRRIGAGLEASIRVLRRRRDPEFRRNYRLTVVRFLIISSPNCMPAYRTLLKGLPRYEVFREGLSSCLEIDPSACYTFLRLLHFGDELLSREEEFLAPWGTSPGRFHLLMVLMHCPEGASNPAALAEWKGVSRATITGLLDGLEKDGLIQRQADPSDRRIIRVNLTDAGRAFLEKITPTYAQWLTDIVGPLSEEERRHLVTLLEKVRIEVPESEPYPQAKIA